MTGLRMAAGQERQLLYYYPPYSFPLLLALPNHVASVLLPLSLHSMTSRSYVLLQKGEDPFHTRFEDLDGLTAFTVYAFHLLQFPLP